MPIVWQEPGWGCGWTTVLLADEYFKPPLAVDRGRELALPATHNTPSEAIASSNPTRHTDEIVLLAYPIVKSALL